MRARALPVTTKRSHCGRRRAAARRHDLDLVAVLQMVAQRHQPAVDLRADAGVADLAVHRIGEIDRRGAARQLDQLALRREAEDLVGVEFQLGVLAGTRPARPSYPGFPAGPAPSGSAGTSVPSTFLSGAL